MKTTTPINRLAELAPIRDGELAGTSETAGARALLAEILSSPLERTQAPPTERTLGIGRPRRRWLAVPALAAGAAIALVVLASGGRGTSSAAAATLEKVARVAGVQHQLVPKRGQFLYTKSVNAYLNTTVPASGAAYNVLVPHVREIWLGPTGGRLYETSGKPRFLTAADRANWIADGRPSLTEGPSENELPPARRLDLSSDPDTLYKRLEHEAAGHGSSLAGEMFTLVGDSLRETSATPAQRAALYQVAARIPGVELIGRVRDSAGRPGVAVAREDDGVRSTLIFDPQTSALLSEEEVALAGNSYGYPPGARVGYSTYLRQAIVESKTATP
jgi:hypothetical protein